MELVPASVSVLLGVAYSENIILEYFNRLSTDNFLLSTLE